MVRFDTVPWILEKLEKWGTYAPEFRRKRFIECFGMIQEEVIQNTQVAHLLWKFAEDDVEAWREAGISFDQVKKDFPRVEDVVEQYRAVGHDASAGLQKIEKHWGLDARKKFQDLNNKKAIVYIGRCASTMSMEECLEKISLIVQYRKAHPSPGQNREADATGAEWKFLWEKFGAPKERAELAAGLADYHHRKSKPNRGFQSISKGGIPDILPSVENCSLSNMEVDPNKSGVEANPGEPLISKAAMNDTLPAEEQSNLTKMNPVSVGSEAQPIDLLSSTIEPSSRGFFTPINRGHSQGTIFNVKEARPNVGKGKARETENEMETEDNLENDDDNDDDRDETDNDEEGNENNAWESEEKANAEISAAGPSEEAVAGTIGPSQSSSFAMLSPASGTNLRPREVETAASGPSSSSEKTSISYILS